MEQEEFSQAVVESAGDPGLALKTLLRTASNNIESKTWSRWAKAKRDFSADEQSLARWITAKLETINAHDGINTISFESSWQADEDGPDEEHEATAAALAIFTGTSYDKNSGAFEAGGESLEDFEESYFYVAREMRDISDEPSSKRADWMLYEDEKYAVTGGTLASLATRVLTQLPQALLLGKERYRFFVLEQPYEVLLGLATKDGFKAARNGQEPQELLSNRPAMLTADAARQPQTKIAEWAERYSRLTSEAQSDRIMEEVIAVSTSSRSALETVIGIGEIATPSPRWKKLRALDLSLSPDDQSSLRSWLIRGLETYHPFAEINAFGFQGCHMTNGRYNVSLMVIKDMDIDTGFGDHDYRCPAGSSVGWDVIAFQPSMNLHLKGSSQKAMRFDSLLSDAEQITFALELKLLLRELDPSLLLGAAPYRAIMASFLNKVAMGIVTPTGWHELQYGQTLRQLYDEVI